MLDKRDDRLYKILRCEFKYIPSRGAKDFEENGLFDLATVWALPSTLTLLELLDQLKDKNESRKGMDLRETKAFADLPEYGRAAVDDLVRRTESVDTLRELALKRQTASPVFALAAAACLYPSGFQLDKMTALLRRLFPEVGAAAATVSKPRASRRMMRRPPLRRTRRAKAQRTTPWCQPNQAAVPATQVRKNL